MSLPDGYPTFEELTPEAQVAWDRDVPSHWHSYPNKPRFVSASNPQGSWYVAWANQRDDMDMDHYQEWMVYNNRLGRWLTEDQFQNQYT